MSETNLNNLIATLKTEAIDAAEKEAAAILNAARDKAQRTLRDAEEQQKARLQEAEKEAEAILIKGKSALRQAARDVTISLQNDLIQLLTAVLERDIQDNFTPELLKSAITKVIENIGSDVELDLSADLKEDLADHIQQRLQTSNQLLGITADSSLSKTINITKKNEGWNYQISTEAITELLAANLSGKWLKILKNETEK